MLLNLSDDEIGLIQEAIYTKVYNLEMSNRIAGETEEQKEYRALLNKIDEKEKEEKELNELSKKYPNY